MGTLQEGVIADSFEVFGENYLFKVSAVCKGELIHGLNTVGHDYLLCRFVSAEGILADSNNAVGYRNDLGSTYVLYQQSVFADCHVIDIVYLDRLIEL